MDAIAECYDPDELEFTLTNLPETLDETYSRILNSIPKRHVEKAIRILQLLLYSYRPLTIGELTDAIVVDVSGTKSYFDPARRMPNPRELSRYCKGLVKVVSRRPGFGGDWYEHNDNSPHSEIHEESDVKYFVLQLSHFSVKEYLFSDRMHPIFQEKLEVDRPCGLDRF